MIRFVLRGGSLSTRPGDCSSAWRLPLHASRQHSHLGDQSYYRNCFRPGGTNISDGFRLILPQ